MSSVPRLFQRQESSRKRAKIGDVFVAQIDTGYIGGRVVAVDAQPWVGADASFLLLYFYKGVADSADVSLLRLASPELLIPPVIGWSRGYFRTVGNKLLSSDQLLDHHVFCSPGTKELWDEYETSLPDSYAGSEYVGQKALNGYLTIEDAVSQVLGRGPTITY